MIAAGLVMIIGGLLGIRLEVVGYTSPPLFFMVGALAGMGCTGSAAYVIIKNHL